MRSPIPVFLLLAAWTAAAQEAPPGFGDSEAATGGARPGQMNEGFIGRDIPHFDPGNDTMSYDGKLWNINDNRLFRARFEKYLNAPPATAKADVEYHDTIDEIMQLLAPGNATKANFERALKLLTVASRYRDDANLCRTLGDAIHAAQRNLQTIERLKRENQLLERERANAEWNSEIGSRRNQISVPQPAQGTNGAPAESATPLPSIGMTRTQRILSEVSQTIENNKARMALLDLTSKGHLQALIMQFFATRRFQHVIIANRFYRALYNDGDNSIEVFKRMVDTLPTNRDAGQAKIYAEVDPKISGSSKGKGRVSGGADTDGGVGAGAGYAPTGGSFAAEGFKAGIQNLSVESLVGGAASAAQSVSKLISSLSQLDGLANEAIRDVNEGVEAYKFLLAENELKSATERLAETFALGEFLPSVRLLSREDKRRALEFTQMSNELLAALEVNDLTRAENLVEDIQKVAQDFDSSKPMAKIETAKTVSAMHLAKAKNALASGDRAGVEAELRAAAEIWPRNPALEEISTTIFSQSDLQNQALLDFQQLVAQGNYRQIYEDRMRFIAATAMKPDKQEELREILNKMAAIEAAIIRSREIEKRGDYAGAWESAERAFREHPDDLKLNQLRSDLTTRASEFVRALRQAEELEDRDQPGSSLAWFLKAQREYPSSEFAREGIERLTRQVLPDAS